MSSVLASETTCSAVCRMVSRRAGSSARFQGSCSDRYLFAAPTTRIAPSTHLRQPSPSRSGGALPDRDGEGTS